MIETECQFCGQKHGVRCPSVKAIEYYENGTVRRVEFMTAADYPPAYEQLAIFHIQAGHSDRPGLVNIRTRIGSADG